MEGSQTPPDPGAPRGRRGREGRAFPKGRQVDPVALARVRALLDGRPLVSDLLIEHLHAIQDAEGRLAHGHLVALAHLMRLSMTEVFEVATFYAHFDVVPDDAPALPAVTVRCCDGLSCMLAGAEGLIASLEATPAGARILRAPCMGRCDTAPTVEVGHRHLDGATPDEIRSAIAAQLHEPAEAEFVSFDAYRRAGGYGVLEEIASGTRSIEEVVAEVEASGLRGLGGAGFPTGRKWRSVLSYPGPRLMAINGDEGEPGTFKDRYFLEREPHRFIEGTLIAARVVEAERIYVYVRDEYPAARRLLAEEIGRLVAAGVPGADRIELRRGAGAYICGEESAMLESIEGKRGLPRHKPPFPSEVGLFGRPTLIQNVETVSFLPEILSKGAGWFSSQGRNGRKGLRHFSVSGRVRNPGVKRAPAGVTARELIDEFCGGMAPGHSFAGYLPGGASGGILPASMADIPLDFGTLEPHGCFVGSGAVVVLSDRDDMRVVARNLIRFFADESCGQCTPCRLGTEKMLTLIERDDWDAALLDALSQVMRDASICGLGQAAPNPVQSVLRFFASGDPAR